MPETAETTRPAADADPQRHREMERRVADHVMRLLDDRRFVIPTSFGPRPVSSMQRSVHRWDRALATKRLMAELDVPDFDLQDKLPTGEGFDVRLSRQVLLAFSQPMAHVRFASLPPTKELIRGDVPSPLSAAAVRRAVGELPPYTSTGDNKAGPAGGPMTLILFSGSGFAEDARRTAREFVDGPPTILIEPNDAGGFDVIGPPGSEFLRELLDPEQHHERRARVAAELERREVDLLTGGVSLDAVASAAKLPIGVVEQSAREWAMRRISAGGEPLRVKRVAGSPMLYRDSSLATSGDLTDSVLDLAGGSTTMPVMDRIRQLFGRSASPQRRIAQLAEQRAALSRQRDRVYEEMARLENREQELREQFMADETSSTRRRITSQLVQLQKDLERRRQTVHMLNQQINVVGTHLHNLEIARTGAGKLPKSEEIADDAAKAEEVLAELQASSELADELAGHLSVAGGTDEEERLFKELSAAADAQKQAAPESNAPAFVREIPTMPESKPEQAPPRPAEPEPEPEPEEPASAPQRAEPEAG